MALLRGNRGGAGVSGNASTGTFKLAGAANIYAASGATLELQVNGATAAAGATQILTANGPGTVLLTGVTDNANVAVKRFQRHGDPRQDQRQRRSSWSQHHRRCQLPARCSNSVSTARAAIRSTTVLCGTGQDWGVLNMNGTFDLNGMSEGFDKLTGTGSVDQLAEFHFHTDAGNE